MRVRQVGFTMGFLMIHFFCLAQSMQRCTITPARLSAKIDEVKNLGQGIYISIKTTLTNTSSDTLTYLSMSCTWQHYYAIDTKEINFITPQCKENTPVLITIAPHQQAERTLRLVSLENMSQLRLLKFKVGLKFATATNTNKANKLLKKCKTIIWSNTISVK